MKQMIIAIIVIIIIVICTSIVLLNNNRHSEISQNELVSGNNIATSGEEIAAIDKDLEPSKEIIDIESEKTKSFKQRIQPVYDYLDEFKKLYGDNYYINGDRIISNARLSKSGDYYIMTFSFTSPKFYNKKELDNATMEAQKNGTYKFEEYTFYKDLDSFLNEFAEEGYKNIINEFIDDDSNANSIFVTSEKNAYFFKPTLDIDKYMLVWIGLPNGIVKTDNEEKEISILLLKNDNIKINNEDYNWNYSGDDFSERTVLTVESYYAKSINKESIVLGSYNTGDEYLYHFDKDFIGSTDGQAGLENAINFNDDSIIIHLPVQGGL